MKRNFLQKRFMNDSEILTMSAPALLPKIFSCQTAQHAFNGISEGRVCRNVCILLGVHACVVNLRFLGNSATNVTPKLNSNHFSLIFFYFTSTPEQIKQKSMQQIQTRYVGPQEHGIRAVCCRAAVLCWAVPCKDPT